MSRQRAYRVAEEIKKEMSRILREIKDPRLVDLVSVTHVELSKDLRHAKIFVSIYGSPDAQQTGLKVLEKAQGFIRTEIGKTIRLRHTPEINLLLDRSLEYSDHIEKVMADLKKESEGNVNE